MFFDLSNYWMFLLLVASLYVAVTAFVQNNVGGKGRLQALQKEIQQLQKAMTEAAKNKKEKEMDAAIAQNWKLTGELMSIQTQLFAVLIVLLFSLALAFPHIEPGAADDVRLQLFDDGLASHCDAAAMDGIYSNCYTIPTGAAKGAWVVDAYLYSASNETLSRNATAIYVEGGNASDIWLQASAQTGLIDGFLGKVPHYLGVSTDRGNYSEGDTAAIRATGSPALPEGRLEANVDSGTFFHVDVPFTLPLINIRRIIGSYGVFLFFAFLIGMAYSIGKSVYSGISKKK